MSDDHDDAGLDGSRVRYHSPLRQERAEDTRRRITTAALELFNEHGFACTTVTAIAAAAGVAVQTVYAAFGSKGAILQALLTQMEVDADAPRWRERVSSATDPGDKLRAFAHWSAVLLEMASTGDVPAGPTDCCGAPAPRERAAGTNGHTAAPQAQEGALR